MSVKRLLIVGDSFTLGVADIRGTEIVDRVGVCYVDRLREALPEIAIDIDAETHRNTSTARNIIDGLIAQHHPGVVLFMVGGSDADLDWRRFVLSEGKIVRNRVALPIYERNLREMVEKTLAAGATPVLSDASNHSFVMRAPYVSKLIGRDIMPWLEQHGGQAESDKRLDVYRDTACAVAHHYDVQIVEFGKMLCDHDPQTVLSADGAHPNDFGHQLIADVLLPVLSRLLAPASGALADKSA